jgi:hypothetical protein
MNVRRYLAIGGLALVLVILAGDLLDQPAAQTKPEGEMRWALYVTLSPVWFDPGEVVGQITPFWVLYALHDALVKPMPGNQMTPRRPGDIPIEQPTKFDLIVNVKTAKAYGVKVPAEILARASKIIE